MDKLKNRLLIANLFATLLLAAAVFTGRGFAAPTLASSPTASYPRKVPIRIAYVNKQNDLWFNSDPAGEPRIVENIDFTLLQPPKGYRWDLDWEFNQRFGAVSGQSMYTSFLLDGAPIKDSDGVAFSENSSLSVQYSPTDNWIFGGMVYQNNVAPGTHVLTWQTGAFGQSSNTVLVRQRWLVLNATLVPETF